MAEQGKYAADAAQFGSAMNSIAHSQAMLAAIKDYKKEADSSHSKVDFGKAPALDVNELLDDVELQKLHEERIAKLRVEREKRAQMTQRGHGRLEEITEGDFLEAVTKAENVVCHFFHRDFMKCKVMDKHLSALAPRYFATRFVKLNAPDAPFFTVKLNIKMLPCVIFFKNGVVVGQVVGFEGLGGLDDFPTSTLEERLLQAGVIEEPELNEEEKEEAAQALRRTAIRKGLHSFKKTESDEDSDLD